MHIIVTLEALDTFIVSISIQLHNLLYADIKNIVIIKKAQISCT